MKTTDLIQDVRYAARTLRKAPGFTLAAVLTLAIGIGASTAIFSMVNGVLLRRLPIGSGNRLVHLLQPAASNQFQGYSTMEVADLNHDLTTISGVAEYHSMAFQLYGHGEPLRVQTGVVSDRFFDMIGVRPLLGRTFRPGEEAVGAPPVVVLSYKFWMDQFRGDSSIVGATFTMNDKVHQVVGVLPSLPGYPNSNDIWMPAGACPFRSAPDMMNDRGMRMVRAYAVLKPGVSVQQARTELTALGNRYHAAYPAAYPADQRPHFDLIGAQEEMTQRARPILLLLLATAAFLLLAAVANVANLSLSRQMRRARELALRVALGAGTARLYRQLSLESLLLTAAGGTLGVALAASGIGVLRSLATRFTPRAGEIHIDLAAVGFAVMVCAITSLAIAVVPFTHVLSRRNIANALRQGSTGTVGSSADQRTRSVLVVAQVAIASVLLVGAGLIGRSLFALENVDAGVDVSNVLTARLDLSFTKYRSADVRRNFSAALLERLGGIPGVSSYALASSLPLNNGRPNNFQFIIDGVPTAAGPNGPRAEATAVSPEYFRTVQVPLLAGRTFTAADRDTTPESVIISHRLATAYWDGRDPVGTRISSDSGKHWSTVIGVVGDVRQNRLDADVTDEIYLPISADGSGDLRVFMRVSGAMPPVLTALKSAVRALDEQQPISQVQTLEEVRGAQLAEPRLTTTLLGAFASLTLLLTATGLAGVIGYGVTQRLPEIAIRMALGANTGKVLALVMRDALLIVVVGLIVGLGASAAGSKLIRGLLFHVAPSDVATYVLVAVVILAMATAACFAPSRRALRADPATVFRAG
jgi:predicted permease